MAGVARVGPRVFEPVPGPHALPTRPGKPLTADAATAIARLERRALLASRRRPLDPMTDGAARPRTEGGDAAAPAADVPAAYPEA